MIQRPVDSGNNNNAKRNRAARFLDGYIDPSIAPTKIRKNRRDPVVVDKTGRTWSKAGLKDESDLYWSKDDDTVWADSWDTDYVDWNSTIEMNGNPWSVSDSSFDYEHNQFIDFGEEYNDGPYHVEDLSAEESVHVPQSEGLMSNPGNPFEEFNSSGGQYKLTWDDFKLIYGQNTNKTLFTSGEVVDIQVTDNIIPEEKFPVSQPDAVFETDKPPKDVKFLVDVDTKTHEVTPWSNGKLSVGPANAVPDDDSFINKWFEKLVESKLLDRWKEQCMQASGKVGVHWYSDDPVVIRCCGLLGRFNWARCRNICDADVYFYGANSFDPLIASMSKSLIGLVALNPEKPIAPGLCEVETLTSKLRVCDFNWLDQHFVMDGVKYIHSGRFDARWIAAHKAIPELADSNLDLGASLGVLILPCSEVKIGNRMVRGISCFTSNLMKEKLKNVTLRALRALKDTHLIKIVDGVYVNYKWRLSVDWFRTADNGSLTGRCSIKFKPFRLKRVKLAKSMLSHPENGWSPTDYRHVNRLIPVTKWKFANYKFGGALIQVSICLLTSGDACWLFMFCSGSMAYLLSSRNVTTAGMLVTSFWPGCDKKLRIKWSLDDAMLSFNCF